MSIPQIEVNRKQVNLKKVLVIAVIFILVATNIVALFGYFSAKQELAKARQEVIRQQVNVKVLNFTNLFIAKVLKAENEVSFEDRLKLENSIRDLNDPELLSQWNKFVDSKTPEDAQKEVKNLLEMLVKKISY